jgi:hypothetical protein
LLFFAYIIIYLFFLKKIKERKYLREKCHERERERGKKGDRVEKREESWFVFC